MNLLNLLNGDISQNDLLNYYNTTIIYKELPNYIRGFVFKYRNIFVIVLNKYLSYYKRKKTILHELAHIELNHLDGSKDFFAFYIDKYEDEADKYIKFLLK